MYLSLRHLIIKKIFIAAGLCAIFSVYPSDWGISRMSGALSTLKNHAKSLSKGQYAVAGSIGAVSLYGGYAWLQKHLAAQQTASLPYENSMISEYNILPIVQEPSLIPEISKHINNAVSEQSIVIPACTSLSLENVGVAIQSNLGNVSTYMRYGLYAGLGAAVLGGGIWWWDRQKDFNDPNAAFERALATGSHWRIARLIDAVDANIFVQAVLKQKEEVSNFLVRSKFGVSEDRRYLVQEIKICISQLDKENANASEWLESLLEDIDYVQKKILEPALRYVNENIASCYARLHCEIDSSDFIYGNRALLSENVLRQANLGNKERKCHVIRKIDTRLERYLPVENSQTIAKKRRKK